jgi:hypothetical protein
MKKCPVQPETLLSTNPLEKLHKLLGKRTKSIVLINNIENSKTE